MVKNSSRSNNSSKLRKAIKKIKNTTNKRYTDIQNDTKNWSRKLKESYKANTKYIRIESSSGINYYKKTKYRPKTGEKRMVLIDGANVAQFVNDTRYSVESIEIVLNYFISKGFECKAIVSQRRMRRPESTNQYLMQQLLKNGNLIVTPGKVLPNSQPSSSYDKFVLQIAKEFDAAIISNDSYTQLVRTNAEFKSVVDCQVIGYTLDNGIFKLVNERYANDVLNRRS